VLPIAVNRCFRAHPEGGNALEGSSFLSASSVKSRCFDCFFKLNAPMGTLSMLEHSRVANKQAEFKTQPLQLTCESRN
jgi:hypothetical protein